MNVLVKNISLSLAAASLFALGSCKNSDIEFSDYEYTSAYFANQSPIRTLVMGEDFDCDNTLDKQHKCKIGATMGGSYHGADVVLDIVADNSLCSKIYFDKDFQNPIKAMPSSHYKLASNQIRFNGEMVGYVEVEFTEQYFKDPLSVQGAYVIPLRITGFIGVDKLQDGTYNTRDFSSRPDVVNRSAWFKQPQDFTLYCVKYMSKFAGYYLRRGKDVINGKENKREYKNEYKFEDEVVSVTTNSLQEVTLHLQYLIDNKVTDYDVVLTFDESQKCTVSSANSNITVKGSGQYTDKGAGKYWGDRDRDQLTLNYTIDDGTNKISVVDTLVTQRRGVKFEDFTYYYKD